MVLLNVSALCCWLCRQRSQRNLQHTWEDLLARQALEASTAEALAAWTNPQA
jgi:hypothetical protein